MSLGKEKLKRLLDSMFVIPIENPVGSRGVGREGLGLEGPSEPWVHLWYDENYPEMIRSLSSWIIDSHVQFSGGDHKTIEEVIAYTLECLCVTKVYFNIEVHPSARTLGDCIDHGNVDSVYKDTLSAIVVELEQKIFETWHMQAVSFNVAGSFSIAEENIHVIQKNDTDYWKRMANAGKFGSLDSETGEWVDHKDLYPLRKDSYESFIAVNCVVSQPFAVREAEFKLRTALSLIFAVNRVEMFCLATKTAATRASTVTYTNFTPAPHSPLECWYSSRSYFPHYGKKFMMSEVSIEAFKVWFAKIRQISKVRRLRLTKGAHFFNIGLNASLEEAFIQYFTSIDAIFGVNGKVKTSIEEGVKKLSDGDKWAMKYMHFWKIRNDLIHGSGRYITDYSNYDDYKKEFRTDPLADLEELVCVALLGRTMNVPEGLDFDVVPETK